MVKREGKTRGGRGDLTSFTAGQSSLTANKREWTRIKQESEKTAWATHLKVAGKHGQNFSQPF
jgi:hypothetical protein